MLRTRPCWANYIWANYTALPPSTSRLIPVMNLASSDARNRQAFATSAASQRRWRGTLEMNRARFSGVSGRPENDSNLTSNRMSNEGVHSCELTHKPVAPSSGQMEFTRIWCWPYSAARPFVACARTWSTKAFQVLVSESLRSTLHLSRHCTRQDQGVAG